MNTCKPPGVEPLFDCIHGFSDQMTRLLNMQHDVVALSLNPFDRTASHHNNPGPGLDDDTFIIRVFPPDLMGTNLREAPLLSEVEGSGLLAQTIDCLSKT